MPKRRLFVSFYGGDQAEVNLWVRTWADILDVFDPIILCDEYNGDFVDTTDTEYVIGYIRRELIRDASVTLVLVGNCTHGRRYVDWEIKASLRRGEISLPNGLLAVTLPGATNPVLPPRLSMNLNRADRPGYANWYRSPASQGELIQMIEDAYSARTSRTHLIANPQERWMNNRPCQFHGITH